MAFAGVECMPRNNDVTLTLIAGALTRPTFDS